MNIIQALILGIVQGITEWLPISSSGHLAIIQNVFGLEVPILFDVLLHVSSLFVLLIVFRQDILLSLKALIKWDWKSEYGKLNMFLIIGIIPTILVGYFLHNLILSLFTNMLAIGTALIITGFILFFCKGKESTKKLNYNNSVLIGLAQGLAIIPGISRSGATIGVGILSGVERKKVIRFSFLLAIPAIIGAALFEAPSLTQLELIPTLVGTITSFVIGYVSLKFIIKLITKNKFWLFSIYCWILGIIVLVTL
ncbi:MAG: undecaprenyl-diphosphate phosphatase [Nanoarchaeota archaeon]|nr:undecaprenyl-diphosphate phosphatase [Nanoarchaeota archaeon]